MELVARRTIKCAVLNLEASGFFGLSGGFEVNPVIVQLLLIEAVDEANEKAANESGHDSNTDWGKSACDLQSSLLEWSADKGAVVGEISRGDGVCISCWAIVKGSSHDSTENTSKERWDGVSTENSTCIMETDFVLKVRAEVLLGEGWNNSDQESNAEGGRWMEEDAWASSDYDSSSESGPLNVLDGEFFLEDGAGGEGGDAAASEGENGVDDDLSLGPGSASGRGEVKRRPEHPQEESSDDWEQIGVVAARWLGSRLNHCAKNQARSDSREWSEGEDSHGSSCIEGLDLLLADHLIDRVADDVDKW